jgi:hypothetical protein
MNWRRCSTTGVYFSRNDQGIFLMDFKKDRKRKKEKTPAG